MFHPLSLPPRGNQPAHIAAVASERKDDLAELREAYFTSQEENLEGNHPSTAISLPFRPLDPIPSSDKGRISR